MESREFCPLTREQATLYEAVLREAEQALEEAEGIGRRGAILGTLTKLKQVCNHPRQLLGDNSAIAGRSGKLTRLQDMLEEIIAVGDRALVFSQFAEIGSILQRHIQDTFGKEALFLHGGVSRRQRDRMVERFQDDKNGPAGVHPVAARRRHRAEPDGGQPRLSLRPLVEPRRGEPGHGPRLPHRPDQQRSGA